MKQRGQLRGKMRLGDDQVRSQFLNANSMLDAMNEKHQFSLQELHDDFVDPENLSSV